MATSLAIRAESLWRRLLDHLAKAGPDTIPPETLERVALIAADVTGCVVGGWKDRAAATLGDYVCRQGGLPESSVWGRGVRVPAARAALACGVSARAFEYGVVDCDAPGARLKPLHSAETLVPVALAVAESRHVSGRDMLVALALGEDLAARLCACLDFSRPLDGRGSVNTLCAAVVAGKLLGLAPEGYRSAFGLALHQLSGIRQGIHYSLGQGLSAQAGVTAAELAHRGLSGAVDLDAELARAAQALGAQFDPTPLFEGLGEVWYASATFKPYPCCRAAHGAVECAQALLERGLTPENMDGVVLHISPWAANHRISRPFLIGPDAHGAAAYSLEYALAATLLRGRCDLDGYTDDAIRDPAIPELIRRIGLTTDGWPRDNDDVFLSVWAEARTKDGRRQEVHVRMPRGNECLGTPLGQDEKKRKFAANLAFGLAMNGEKAGEIWELFRRMPHLESLVPLADALRG